ncbi:MAG: hypothetical protein QG655_3371 [Actinomycetota bacterium]|nr:hypothetical protein [Actinomycetota bacterium]HPY25087.1 hypothetical protein [Mycobacterium sp.]
MKAHVTRTAAAARGPALTAALATALSAALVTGCATATEKGKEIASSASSIGSSAASAAGSAASSAASAAESAASTAGSIASSAVSSVLDGKPMTIDAPGIGAITLDGPTAAVYEKAGGAATLGAPTAAPQKVTGADGGGEGGREGGGEGGGEGTVYSFTAGSIFESPEHGPKLLRGEILRIYNANGGPGGALGWPVADETETGGGPGVANGGWIGEFENGTISWLNDGNGIFGETVAIK